MSPIAPKKERDLYMVPDEWRLFVESAYKHNTKIGLLWDLVGQAGLRISEALALKPCDFDFEKNIIHVRTLKRRKRDTIDEVKLPEAIMELFKKYFKQNMITIKDTELIWNFSRIWAWKIFKRIIKDTGMNKRYSPHALRHCHCIMVLDITKGDLVKTAKRLRQMSTNMPMRYSHLTEEIQKEVVSGLENKYIKKEK